MPRIRGTQDFSDALHSRAREAASEQRKLLISLATGGVGVFFLALTTNTTPPLTYYQQVLVTASLGFLSAAIAAGLFAWHADALRNYYWAQVEGGDQEKGGVRYDDLSGSWKRRLRWSTSVLIFAFLLGQLFAVVYILARIYNI
jgi:hypothetical protein